MTTMHTAARLAATATLIVALTACAGDPPAQDADPAQDTRPVGRAARGEVIVPTHQVLRPMGRQLEFPGRPTDAVLLGGGKVLVIKNRKSLVFVRTSDRVILQTLAAPSGGMSFHGIVADTETQSVFVTGTHNSLWIARFESGVARWDGAVTLPGPNGQGACAPGGLAWTPSGELCVTLSRNNTLGIVDVKERKLVREIPVGVAPYAVVVHSDRAWVSNWGGRHPIDGDATDNSSGTQVVVDPVTNVAASGTVSVVDLSNGEQVAEVDVGLHPCDLAFDPKRGRLYVANANSDTVSILDVGSSRVIGELSVLPDARLPFGSSPNALALTPDGTRLYVANGTNNAVAVLDPLETDLPMGHLPVGWYPGGLVLDAERDRLYVLNTKGVGSLNPPTGRSGLNTHNHLGSLTVISNVGKTDLAAASEIVRSTNALGDLAARLEPPAANAVPVPVPLRHGEPSVFEHVLYIIKENRTYDQVLGDLPQGNGDPSLCVFGREITPNHHALVEEFVLLDNFYCSGILSADGHQWTNEAFVADYLEKSFGGFTRSYPYEGDDPLAFAPTGFLWDNVLRRGKTFRCYGEMVHASITPEGTFEELYADYLQGGGKFEIRATSKIDAITANMCETFIGFPGTVSDVYRASEFLAEFERFERDGDLPNLMVMLLPNDHTSGTRPGMPTPAAAVADNDLALGRIVDAISHSRFWSKTCIFVVQDDPQAGWDHVDGHRTVAMVISPYTKRGAVVSERYAQPGMVKTIELILGLPPMNQMDLLATPMHACFTEQADTRPYTVLENSVPLDSLNASLDQLEGPAHRDAVASLALDLDEIDHADEGSFNRILWHAMKGHDVPYPERLAGAHDHGVRRDGEGE